MTKDRAVIFDLDDTLVSEKQYIRSGYRVISVELTKRLTMDAQSIYELLLGLFDESPVNVFNRLYDQLSVPHTEDDIWNLVEIYRNHHPDITFYDDVPACLHWLGTKGIKTGIITDGYISTQQAKLKALDAYRLFDHIIITEELGREYWKPHPKAFEIMKDTLHVEYEDMVYIGDNPKKDFYIGSIYPIQTVRICREGVYKDVAYLGGREEDYTIDSLTDINTILCV